MWSFCQLNANMIMNLTITEIGGKFDRDGRHTGTTATTWHTKKASKVGL